MRATGPSPRAHAPSVILLAVAGLASACGSRSGLLDTDAYVDRPPEQGGGGSGASGGADGTGGGLVRSDCALERAVPEVGIAGENVAQVQPAMTFTDPNQRQVTVAMGWRAGMGPMSPQELRHTSFAPWGSWPSGPVGPVFLADFDGGRAFAIAASGGIEGNFSLAHNGPPGMGSTARVQPELTPGSGTTGEVIDLFEPGRPAAFATVSGVGLITQVQRQGMGQVLRHTVMTYSPGGASIVDQFILGCGGVGDGGALPASTERLPGDEVPGFMVMFGSARLEDCGGPLGPPTELYAVRLPEEAQSQRDFDGVVVTGVRHVRLGGESIYAATTAAGDVHVGRLGPQGFGASFTLPGGQVDPAGGVDVAVFEGGRVAVAYRSLNDGTVAVSVVDPTLSEVESTYRTGEGQRPELLASPFRDALLLAHQSEAQARPRVVLSRLTCAP